MSCHIISLQSMTSNTLFIKGAVYLILHFKKVWGLKKSHTQVWRFSVIQVMFFSPKGHFLAAGLFEVLKDIYTLTAHLFKWLAPTGHTVCCCRLSLIQVQLVWKVCHVSWALFFMLPFKAAEQTLSVERNSRIVTEVTIIRQEFENVALFSIISPFHSNVTM